MKTRVSGSILGALAAAAILLPLGAAPAAAQVPGGSYLQSCRDARMRGDRLVATCRTQEGRWNQTSIDDVGQCAGGVANSDGRLVCGRRGGGLNTGNEDERGRDRGRESGWRGERDRERGWQGERGGYGDGYWSRGGERDTRGQWYGGPGYGYGWSPGYYGR